MFKDIKEVEWKEQFNIGVDSIDKAHQKLFSIVRKMLEFSDNEKKSQWVCMEGIKFLKSYTVKHFEDEEKFMRENGYSGYVVHKRLHDDFRDKTVPALETGLVESDYSEQAMEHFLGFCLGWLTGHVMIEDRVLTGRIVKRTQGVLPENVVASLENVLIQSVGEVFGLDIKLISEQYAGEAFGDSIVCRMAYRSDEGKQLYVFFILEERLVLDTVGQMMGIQFKQVDSVVISATKQISWMLMDRMNACVRLLEKYKPYKEHVITKEQLAEEFQMGRPYYSLLFDTGIGYFAFCIKHT